MGRLVHLLRTAVFMEHFFSLSYRAVSYHTSGHNVAYNPKGFKASTGFGSPTKTKKIYDGGAHTEDEGQSHPSKYDYV